MKPTIKPTKFEEAVQKLGSRTVVTSRLTTEEWAEVPVALRERAFFSARVESARWLQTAQDYMGDYLSQARMENGGLKAQGRAEFVAMMREMAMDMGLGKVGKDGTISPEIRESDLTDLRSLSRLQLIFDTQVEAANEYGYWKQGQDPATLAVFPAQRFIRVRPVKSPRPYHADAEGEVRLKSDLKFWLSLNRDFQVPWGPWGFNSGMGVEDVDRLEAEDLGLLKPDDKVTPIDKPFNEGLDASLRGLDKGLIEKLRADFGDQVDISKDVVRWKGTKPTRKPKTAPAPTPAPTPTPTPAPAHAPKLEPTPTVPTAKAKEAVDDIFKRAKIDPDKDITEAQAKALKRALRKKHGMQLKDVINGELDTKGITEDIDFKAKDVHKWSKEFLGMLDRDLISVLPKIKVQVVEEITGTLGDFNPYNLTLRIATKAGGEAIDPTQVRETLWHEMVHWVHFYHSDENFRTQIRTRYKLLRSEGYDFNDGVDDYAASIYEGVFVTANGRRINDTDADPFGTELTTRLIQRLARDDKNFTTFWNNKSHNSAWRKSFAIALQGLHYTNENLNY